MGCVPVSLQDELEKISAAERWLAIEPPGSRLYNVARDHLLSEIEWNPDHKVRTAAQAAVDRWLAQAKENGRDIWT